MSKVIPMIGKRFGRLTVIADAGSAKGGIRLWECECDCGNRCVVRGTYLRNGTTRSCGCISREMTISRSTTHGKRNTRLYRIWHGMKSRCYFHKNPNFCDYGARGITVCEEWLNSFQAFHDWATSHGYADNLSIDRIDVNGSYCPENCRWATMLEQQNNKHNNTSIEIDGRTMNLAQWAKVSGVKQQTISYRYKKGIRGADLIKPPQKKGESLSNTESVPAGNSGN